MQSIRLSFSNFLFLFMGMTSACTGARTVAIEPTQPVAINTSEHEATHSTPPQVGAFQQAQPVEGGSLSHAPTSPPRYETKDDDGVGAGSVDIAKKSGSAEWNSRSGRYVPQEKQERPGLATHWGETRTSLSYTTSFYRAEPNHPFATATLYYNDARGANAMASYEGFFRRPASSATMASSGVVVSLVDEYGRLLPGFEAHHRNYAIGESGRRYKIILINQTPARFETIVSVDGLDVLDGQPANYSKRGYILDPYGRLEIDGFRQSDSTVASFRFGDVQGSYAARSTGSDRNVGVIGVALFHEQGTPVWPWDPYEIERRRSANPFPGRFASPPPPW